MTTPTDSVPLLERTLELVRNAPRNISFTEMSKETGVSIPWISRFASNKIGDPGVKNVQALHDYLINVGK